MNHIDIASDLKRDEGLRLKPYLDSVGKLTIGYGRNLDDNGISEVEAETMLKADIEVAASELDHNIPWWRGLPEAAQNALVNMVFNLGWPRLSLFKKMLAALETRDYETAAVEALHSKWAGQVGERAKRIAALMNVSL